MGQDTAGVSLQSLGLVWESQGPEEQEGAGPRNSPGAVGSPHLLSVRLFAQLDQPSLVHAHEMPGLVCAGCCHCAVTVLSLCCPGMAFGCPGMRVSRATQQLND